MKNGETLKSFWSCLMFLIWVAVFFLGMNAHADSNWMPTVRHLQAAEQGSDCSIFRSLAFRAKKEVARQRAVFADGRQVLKQRRADLEECARHRGLASFQTDEDEALAAEVCPAEYRSWLNPGYRMMAVKEDLRSERESLQVLTLQMQLHCSAMPLPVPVSVVE